MTKNTSDNTKELPNGWEWKKLGEVIQLQRGYDLPKQDRIAGNVPLISSNGRIDTHNVARIKGAGVITGRSGSIGYIHYEEEDFFPLNTALFVKEFFGNNPRYIFYLLTSLSDEIKNVASFSAVPTLDRKNVHENIITALPPLKEQERIVQKLDTAFQSLDEAITLQKENIAHTQELKKAVLVEQIANLDCEMKKLGEITDNLDGKRKPVKSSDRQNLQGQYPYYGASGIIDYVNEYIFDGEFLLISEDGANLVVRKTPIAFIATGKFWVNNHAHIVKAKAKVSINRYLEYALSNTDISDFITGSAQPKLSQGKLNEIQIPLPPLPEQEKIVAYLDTSFAKLDALIVEQEARLEQLMELKKSILQEAFEGKL